jgi:hypothetical protein
MKRRIKGDGEAGHVSTTSLLLLLLLLLLLAQMEAKGSRRVSRIYNAQLSPSAPACWMAP